jgi:hypothetical protein
MKELNLTAKTTFAQIQTFQQAVGKDDEIRARKENDGTHTLYVHSKGTWSMNRDPQLREQKQKAAFTAVEGFLKGKFGPDTDVTKLVFHASKPLTTGTLDAAIDSAVKTKYRALQTTLADKDLRAAFEEHLKKEFAPENLEFFEAAEALKLRCNDTTVSIATIKTDLTTINNGFVQRVKGSKEVNVSDAMVTKFGEGATGLLTGMEELIQGTPSPNTSEAAAKDTEIRKGVVKLLEAPAYEIFRLMETDSFRRFQNTKEYEHLVQLRIKANLTS